MTKIRNTRNITTIKSIKKEPESQFARSELNLEQNYIFTVSTYKGKSREIIVTDYGPKGEVHERRAIIGRTIQGAETGILTTQHFKVYLALSKIWDEAGRPVEEPVKFTILRIIKLLGIVDAGPNYEMIKHQLITLRQIPLTFIDSFFIPHEGTYKSLRPFTILNHLEIHERSNKATEGQTRSYGEFQFDRYILESLVNNHVHPLRLDVIRGFRKHRDLSILLYTYIDRNLAFKNEYSIGLEKLFERLDLSQRYVKYPSQRKQKIQPVCKLLEGRPLSTGTLSYCRIHRTVAKKDYKLICRKTPFSKRLKQHEEPSGYLPESDSELLSRLVQKGLTGKQATGLLSGKKPEIIKAQLGYFPFRLEEYKVQGREINQPAILYDSIKENWKVPKSYLEAEKEKEREAEQLERERIARLEQEERDREEQERADIEAYKENLDLEEKAKLRERALREIKSMEGIREEFISDPLIEATENEILKSEMEEGKN